MSAMQIMTYDARFYDQIVALVTGIQQHELDGNVTLEEQHDLIDIPGTYLQGKGNFWLALLEDEVVGTIGLVDVGNYTGSLKKMFVAAAHRGGKKAIAPILLQHLLDWAQTNGFKHLYLGTGPTLLAAHRFYEKNGFRTVKDTDIPPAILPTLLNIDSKRYHKAI